MRSNVTWFTGFLRFHKYYCCTRITLKKSCYKSNKDVTVNQLSIGLWNTQLIMIDKRNAVIGADTR